MTDRDTIIEKLTAALKNADRHIPNFSYEERAKTCLASLEEDSAFILTKAETLLREANVKILELWEEGVWLDDCSSDPSLVEGYAKRKEWGF